MLNAISVDVEDYYNAANLAAAAPRFSWSTLPSRVETATHRVLDMFASHEVKATFFVLAPVALGHRSILNRIVGEGHELASHGYSHELVYNQTPEQFFDDICSSKKILEDCSGKMVAGYRAPNFSITAKSPWAYEKLIEAGYLYDSSLYPVWHPRYANTAAQASPHRIEIKDRNLFILPLAVAEFNICGKSVHLPVAGGAYWRVLPRIYTDQLLAFAVRQHWRTCYFHPWEFDEEQPVFNNLSFFNSLKHYRGIAEFRSRVEAILTQFPFGPISEAAKQSFGDDFLVLS